MGTQKILIKKSTVTGKVPLPDDLDIGELAVNTADPKLYTKHNDGTIKDLTPGQNTTVTFDEASNRATINTGESLVVLFGKLKKWFTDFGSLAWKSAVSWSTDITGKPTTISGYGITDAYTKTEVDNKVAAVYKYKGSVASYANLPSTGLTAGDVYNCTDTGMNYGWTGSAWDALGVTYSVATQSVSGLMSSTDKTKLDGIAAGAQVNNISNTNATALTGGGNTTLHKHSFANLDSKPTNISGYGITDAYTKTEIDNKIPSNSLSTGSIYDSSVQLYSDINHRIINCNFPSSCALSFGASVPTGWTGIFVFRNPNSTSRQITSSFQEMPSPFTIPAYSQVAIMFFGDQTYYPYALILGVSALS
jgi:hypothetical protein